MASTAPYPASLDNARHREDPLVRELVLQVARLPGGPAEYNRLLMTLDGLQRAPELLYLPDSRLAEAIRAWPAELRSFFAPAPLPEWVDPEKLKRAARIWEENSVSLLFVLFAASLPACYLLHRGISALYRTGKLAKRQYLAQRLYETGLMVDSVLDTDGLRIIEDEAEGRENLLVEALRKAGLENDWEWNPGRHAFVRRDGAPGGMEDGVRARLSEAARTLGRSTTGRRYVWGRGFLAARKVRFLHGYMRHMLMHPDPSTGVPEWDVRTLGVPVNQEDQAYTLLTFGLVMVRSLEKLGLRLSPEDREAFLHRWRLIGHLMGIEDGLMTDRWDEATALFEIIQAREAGRCPEGEVLTTTLVEFLEHLIPARWNLSRQLPVQFVGHFLGDKAGMLLSPELERRRVSLAGRLGFGVVRVAIRVYYVVRRFWFRVLPGIPSAVTREMHVLAEELIESCWSAFERNPFYVPRELTVWQRDPDATEAFVRRMRGWQVRMFDTILLSVALWILAGLLLFAAVVLAVFQAWMPAALSALGGLASAWGYGAVGHWWVEAVRSRRPVPPDSAGPPSVGPARRTVPRKP